MALKVRAELTTPLHLNYSLDVYGDLLARLPTVSQQDVIAGLRSYSKSLVNRRRPQGQQLEPTRQAAHPLGLPPLPPTSGVRLPDAPPLSGVPVPTPARPVIPLGPTTSEPSPSGASKRKQRRPTSALDAPYFNDEVDSSAAVRPSKSVRRAASRPSSPLRQKVTPQTEADANTPSRQVEGSTVAATMRENIQTSTPQQTLPSHSGGFLSAPPQQQYQQEQQQQGELESRGAEAAPQAAGVLSNSTTYSHVPKNEEIAR
jgi:hypothetical protein